MTSGSMGPRRKQPLSQPFNTRLNAYAVAASAAGVSLLALVKPANAEIVFTPANAPIPFDKNVSVDLNHDGIPDFRFFFYSTAYHSFNGSVNVRPRGVGAVITTANGYAAALNQGADIGPGQAFKDKRLDLVVSHGFEYGSSQYNRGVFGPWVGAQDLYLGVQFPINGQTHYGWIRLSVQSKERPLQGTITGYAYETVANQPIHAGATGDEASIPKNLLQAAKPTLGMFALGAQGVALWRKEEPAVSAH